MGNICSQERGLGKGLSRSKQSLVERLRMQQRWELDCETTRASDWGRVSFSGASWKSRAGQRQSGIQIGHRVTMRLRCNAGRPGP